MKKGGAICHAIHSYAKESNKYMKDHDKNTTSLYLMYLDASNLYGWTIFQKFPIDSFEWVKKLSKFDESFVKDYVENSNEEYFLKIDVEYPENLFSFHNDLPIIPERNKIKNIISFFVTFMTRKTMLFI